MPKSIDFCKGIFLHIIPVRIIVPCFYTVVEIDRLLPPNFSVTYRSSMLVPC